ncbi:MAG: phosphoribosylformylglycinamidine synthase subunit PurQ [Dongiaceae bacterium]
MKSAVITFPGSNCDRDVIKALTRISGQAPAAVWHGDKNLPKVDLIVVPGGFSYGDYLRTGAIAAHSPIMQAVKEQANKGVKVLGICNGFQILAESGLLPGVLLRNRGLKFICRTVTVKVEANDNPFTKKYKKDQVIRFPIAHGEGNYFADPKVLDELESKNLIAFRYCDEKGQVIDSANPNGSSRGIAGIFNQKKNVLGLMPHPERVSDPYLEGVDGIPLFESLVESLS